MNEFLVIFGVVLSAVVAGVIYNLYYGVHGTLSNANVGEVYHFDYLQPLTGEAERFMVKIIGKQTLTVNDIQRLNARSNYRRLDANFMRTSHLVTGQSPDGKIRNFYAERTTNCKRTTLGKLMFTMGLANML